MAINSHSSYIRKKQKMAYLLHFVELTYSKLPFRGWVFHIYCTTLKVVAFSSGCLFMQFRNLDTNVKFRICRMEYITDRNDFKHFSQSWWHCQAFSSCLNRMILKRLMGLFSDLFISIFVINSWWIYVNYPRRNILQATRTRVVLFHVHHSLAKISN